MDIEVYLHTHQGAVVSIGRLTDVSVSGGFVKAHLPARTIALVSLRTRLPGLHRDIPSIQGYVVRREAAGVGIEWFELAPVLVRFLTQHLTISPADPRLCGDRFGPAGSHIR